MPSFSLPLIRAAAFLAITALSAAAIDLVTWDIPGSNVPPAIQAGTTAVRVSGSPIVRGSGLNVGPAAAAGWRSTGFNQTLTDQAAFDQAYNRQCRTANT